MTTGKTELSNIISEKMGTTKKQASQFINAFTETVSEKMAAQERVQLTGFGTFTTRKNAARKGTNPGTGKKINIPAKNAPAFKPGKGLKDSVNKK